MFVILGGLVARRYRWVAIRISRWPGPVRRGDTGEVICPLAPLDPHGAGQAGYEGSFIERYLVPIIYPEGLTRDRSSHWQGSWWA